MITILKQDGDEADQQLGRDLGKSCIHDQIKLHPNRLMRTNAIAQQIHYITFE